MHRRDPRALWPSVANRLRPPCTSVCLSKRWVCDSLRRLNTTSPIPLVHPVHERVPLGHRCMMMMVDDFWSDVVPWKTFYFPQKYFFRFSTRIESRKRKWGWICKTLVNDDSFMHDSKTCEFLFFNSKLCQFWKKKKNHPPPDHLNVFLDLNGRHFCPKECSFLGRSHQTPLMTHPVEKETTPRVQINAQFSVVTSRLHLLWVPQTRPWWSHWWDGWISMAEERETCLKFCPSERARPPRITKGEPEVGKTL